MKLLGKIVKLEDISRYLESVQFYVDGFFESIGSPFSLVLSVYIGERYAKILAVRGNGRGKIVRQDNVYKTAEIRPAGEAWGFIDLATGDCLSAWSYKSPNTKTPRGNIFDSMGGMGFVEWFGFSDVKVGKGLSHGVRMSGVRLPYRMNPLTRYGKGDRLRLMNTANEMSKSAAFESFLKGCQEICDKAHKDYIKLSASVGGRYIKIISTSHSQDSVHCFVDGKNGDVLKAASWKAPAKHARGNIFDANNGLAKMQWTGPEYLK